MSERTIQELQFRTGDIRVVIKINSPADDAAFLLPEQVTKVVNFIKSELKAFQQLDSAEKEVK